MKLNLQILPEANHTKKIIGILEIEVNLAKTTLCKSSKAITTDAAQNLADGSSSASRIIEIAEQAIHVSKSMPACVWLAEVHITRGTKVDCLICFIKFFSFRTRASFPSFLIFCFENLFKLSKLSADQREEDFIWFPMDLCPVYYEPNARTTPYRSIKTSKRSWKISYYL